MKSKGVTATMKDIEIVNDESSVLTVHLHGEAKAGATGKFEHLALFTDLKSFFFVSLFFLFMLTCAYLCYLGTLVGFEHTCGDLGTICLQVYYEKQVLPNIVK